MKTTAFTLDYASAYYDADGLHIFNHLLDDPKPVFRSIKQLHEYIQEEYKPQLANNLIKAFLKPDFSGIPPTCAFTENESDEDGTRIWIHRYSLIPIDLEFILDDIKDNIDNLLSSKYQ